MKRLLQAPMKLNLRSGLWVGAMSHERSCESIFWLSRFGGICFLVSGRAYSPTVCPITRPSWNPMVRSDTRTRWSDLCHEKKQSHNRIDGRYPGSMFQLRPSLWVRHLGWKGTRTMQAWRPNGRMIGGLKLHFGDAASKLSDLWGNMFLFFFEIRGIVWRSISSMTHWMCLDASGIVESATMAILSSEILKRFSALPE